MSRLVSTLRGDRLTLPILIVSAFTVFIAYVIGARAFERHLILLALVALLLGYFGGQKLATRADSWLPTYLVLAVAVKLAGASARYYVLQVIYAGNGDAGRYHLFGLQLSDLWRDLVVPEIATAGFGSSGTRFTAWVTGLLYGPYEPTLLGGFWIYGLLALVGQVFVYLGYRRSTSRNLKWFALLILFWPTLVYWPSSIGKEALLILFLGIAFWGAAGLYGSYRFRWLVPIAVGLFLTSQIRVHVAALATAGVLAGTALERWSGRPRVSSRRLLMLGMGVVLSIPLIIGVADRFGVGLDSLSTEDLDPVFQSVGDTTGQGGSAVAGGVIRGPLDVPGGVLKVLFRPLPTDANNAQTLVASVEGMMLLGLVVWRAPTMISNRSLLRSSPMLIMSLTFTLLFIWAWSAILNLGILARQRALVLPFFLALVAAMGWNVLYDRETDGDDLSAPARPRQAEAAK